MVTLEAVAARIGSLSFGTETGSSVRRPASYCGIVGFKPTFGIISRHGSFRGAWSQDHVGPVPTRTAEHIALALDPVAGYDARDPASVRKTPAYAQRLNENVKGLRVGVLGKFLDGVDAPVRAAFRVRCASLSM